ncbi:BolA family protein [Sedimenticola selenatireducens]|jgi:acid stress-induced BolA-like protein IbaG/YrbA|uniref:BolA/IbaG family iron-sulfur metabolism protein n=1 Tax=Sedimenticola selenatireducens TaxID=191960 RepID=A0A558E0N7_9GAMM|nr:BolA/IbaG family iron-sulfur metabolism protein [Sedimenticola selenatireducens]TVO75260.1 BolA/IbaG family iron-sulfur metabolism protein [Sedimenticola selenatireducens]TVT66887.1 MAG: BolA/IbaG family iron-sulfur metabolism protein [Sedimenticola selenatireducens]
MEIEAIVALIESGMPGCQALVTGDGRHFEAIVISEEFEGKSPLQKQRMVMATVKAQLESDQLHALSIKTYTKEQWQTLQG